MVLILISSHVQLSVSLCFCFCFCFVLASSSPNTANIWVKSVVLMEMHTHFFFIAECKSALWKIVIWSEANYNHRVDIRNLFLSTQGRVSDQDSYWYFGFFPSFFTQFNRLFFNCENDKIELFFIWLCYCFTNQVSYNNTVLSY